MTTKKGLYSTAGFFQALRMAADKEDLVAFDDVLDQAAAGAYGATAGALVATRQVKQPTPDEIKKAICDNLDRIIKICDDIISDPTSTPEEIKWAKGKKNKAKKDRKKHGCPPPPVA